MMSKLPINRYIHTCYEWAGNAVTTRRPLAPSIELEEPDSGSIFGLLPANSRGTCSEGAARTKRASYDYASAGYCATCISAES